MKIKTMGITAIIYVLLIFLNYIPHSTHSTFLDFDPEETNNISSNVYVHQIKLPFEKWVKKNLNLEPGGGGSKINEKVEWIDLHFNAERRVTIKEARALILAMLDKLMEMINTNEKMRPYLAEYPISHDRFDLSISFTGINGLHPDGAISDVYYESPLTHTFYPMAILVYHAHGSIYHSYIDGKESYKLAVKQNASFPKEYLTVHRGEPYEEDIDQFLYTFSNELAKKCKIRRRSIGGVMNQHIEEINGEYNAFHRASIEEARELGIFVTQKLLKDLNNNEKLRPYLVEYPFPLERVKIRIYFTNEKFTPYFDGSSLESILLEGNHITYFEEHDSKIEPVVVGQESYQEAFQIVEGIPADKRKYIQTFNF